MGMGTPYWEVKFGYRYQNATQLGCFLVRAATSFQAATVAIDRGRQIGWMYIQISNVNKSPVNRVIE